MRPTTRDLVTCACRVTNLMDEAGALVPPVNPCQCARDIHDVEWHNTRRGLFGVSEVRTPTPSRDLVSFVWFTELGDSGESASRAYAIAEAYTALVRGR